MAFLPGVLSYFLTLCIQQCCSLLTLLYLISIFSISGLIFTILIVCCFKRFYDSLSYILIIIISICFIILIIFSCLSIFKYFKFSKKITEITQDKKKLLDIFSIIFTSLSLINFLLSLCCAIFNMEKIEKFNIIKIAVLYQMIFAIIIFCCFLCCLFWHSLHDFRGKIHGNENCCSCCCCKINKTDKIKNIIITVQSETNNVIFVPNTYINEPKNDKKEKDVKKNMEQLDVHFALTTGQKFVIKAPAIITIEKLFNFFFDIFNVRNSERNNIFFLSDGGKLEKNSDYLINDKFNNEKQIIIYDQENIIKPKQEIFIFQ